MKSYTKLQCFLTVFLLCFVNLGYNARTLVLYEGDICGHGDGETSNYICRNWENCPVPIEELTRNIYPLCSFNGITPIVCCPPEKNILNQFTITTIKPESISPISKTSAATEKCRKYSELINITIIDPVLSLSKMYHNITDCYEAELLISGGEMAKPKEFPHMALLGFGENPDNESWFCGGSLISNRFVLTAAHCEKTGDINPSYAKWARLGELDYNSKTADARPTDYKIEERIIHPNYKSRSLYNDIALFRLERDVHFSAYVRPICLNTDNTLTPPAIIATASRLSSRLYKVQLNIIPAEQCNNSFSYISNINNILAKGIVENSMLCTGNAKGVEDTCKGDSGGPIQIKHNSYKCMNLQIGITSFGQNMCGHRDSSTAYTRVSNYISWIERIVWPKM
ncbi:venom protease-like isoform X2 [Metopolophium dirhodum]|uniref:venom protease-like isoform X2 n=1 Tax=Metopolophium dirhodum TaxID=44670 RepID=UPI0029904D6F|nr:venom protease-like isoform X2 [Metopolophium dirhodum]